MFANHWTKWPRRAWTPLEQGAALTAWLRGDSIVQAGGVSSQWTDKGLAGNHFTSSLTAQPTYTASDSSFNNFPSLTWDGSNDVMTGPALSSLISNSAYTVFMVFSATAIDTNTATIEQNDALIADGDGGSGGFFGVHLRSTPNVNLYNWDGSRDFASASISTGVATIVTARHGSGTLGIRTNEGAEVTAASGNTSTLTHPVALGKGWASAWFSGKIAEVCILNTWPGEVVAHQFRRYLADRYLISL